jgi:hypothetical protein
LSAVPGFAADRGHEFVKAVCDAIEAATSERRARRSNAFRVGNADLVGAVERELFIRIVNRWDLHAAFRGEPGLEIRGADELERRAMELLLERAGSSATVRARSIPRRIARALLAKGRGTEARRLPPTGAPAVPAHAIACFIVKHEKFARYLEPLIATMGAERCVAVALHGTERATEALGVPTVPLRPRRPGLEREYTLLRDLLEQITPRAIVVLEGNAPIDEVANQAGRSLGIPTVCIQQGWASFVHTGFRRMTFSSMAVWGAGFADLLFPLNPEQRFDVTGSIALDPAVGMRTPLPGSEAPTALFALQVVAPTIPHTAMVSFLRLIDSVAERCPGARLLVREHPGHPISAQGYGWEPRFPSIALVPPDRYGLRDVLAASDTVVSISSTTLLEGAALLRPAVVVNETSVPRHLPDLEAWGAGIEAKTAEDALAAIVRVLGDDAFRRSFDPGMRAFRAEFFRGADVPGIANTHNLIERIGASGEGRS